MCVIICFKMKIFVKFSHFSHSINIVIYITHAMLHIKISCFIETDLILFITHKKNKKWSTAKKNHSPW